MKSVMTVAKKYHRFDDGLLLSLKYFHDKKSGNSLAAQIVLYARNHESPVEKWDAVQVTIEGVEELCAKVNGNEFNSICCGVKFLKFGDFWCVDVDGNYPLGENPESLDDVRKYGHCYIIGKKIKTKTLRRTSDQATPE